MTATFTTDDAEQLATLVEKLAQAVTHNARPMPRDDLLWTDKDVAEYLRLSPHYVAELARAGRIPHHMTAPKRRRYLPDEVKLWAEGRMKR